MNTAHFRPGDRVLILRTEWSAGQRPGADPICVVGQEITRGWIEVTPERGTYPAKSVARSAIIRKLPERAK